MFSTITTNWGKGNKALAPTAAYDNGRFTYFSFDNGRELPLIYKVMADGTEMLLNSHVEGDTVVTMKLQNILFCASENLCLVWKTVASMNKARLIEPAPAIMILSVLVERRKADEILRQIQNEKIRNRLSLIP